jgi:hypothetical protein
MRRSLIQAADALVAALREVVAVDDAQRKRLEETRAMAQETHTRFERIAEAVRSGSDPATAQREFRETFREPRFSIQKVEDDYRSSGELSLRRETAFCDIYDALIDLAAAGGRPGPLPSLIRELRLLAVEQTELPFPAPTPSFEVSDSEDTPELRWRGMREQAFRFMGEMDVHARQVQASLDRKIELERSLLERALHEAEALRRSLTD